jgi:hypothetical protein
MQIEEIILPHRLNGATLGRVVSAFLVAINNKLPRTIYIDFKNLTFIEPVGVTFLENFTQWLKNHGTHVHFQGHDGCNKYRSSISFLDDAQFFAVHLGETIRDGAHPRSTTQPLVNVHHERSHHWVRSTLTPWLSGRLDVPMRSLGNFQVCVQELMNNIKDHSSLEIGCIFSQHFPKLKRVNISVADFGHGIPKLVQKIHNNLDDCAAIIKATENGFTTKTTSRNMGVGLNYLIQTVAENNGGKISIFSLRGAVKFCQISSGVKPIPLEQPGYCPGTTIDIELRTDRIKPSEGETEEFIW